MDRKKQIEEAARHLRKKKKLKTTEQFIDPFTVLACRERAEGDRLEEGFVYGAAYADANPDKDPTVLVEAIRKSIARSDVYGDSYCSKPIREALRQWESQEEKIEKLEKEGQG
jgi:hypothetical protein